MKNVDYMLWQHWKKYILLFLVEKNNLKMFCRDELKRELKAVSPYIKGLNITWFPFNPNIVLACHTLRN